jgi:hypothetical protein
MSLKEILCIYIKNGIPSLDPKAVPNILGKIFQILTVEILLRV